MKRKRSIILMMICCLLLAGAISWTEASAEGQPIAVLPEIRYEFEPVPDGTQIHHDFIIQNKGTATLKIEKVRTG